MTDPQMLKYVLLSLNPLLKVLLSNSNNCLQLLYTTKDHFIAPEWEILRSNTRRIVSTHLVSRLLLMASGNIDNMNHRKYKRSPTVINDTFYLVTRMLDVAESLIVKGEISLQPTSKEYLDGILKSEHGLEDLTNRAKAKVAQIEEAVKQNKVGLNETFDYEFLNEWLLESIRKPTM